MQLLRVGRKERAWRPYLKLPNDDSAACAIPFRYFASELSSRRIFEDAEELKGTFSCKKTSYDDTSGELADRCWSNSNSLISWLKRESYNSPHGPLGEQASLSSSSTRLAHTIPGSIRAAAKYEVEVLRFTIGASREREGACCFLSHIRSAGAGASSTGLDPK